MGRAVLVGGLGPLSPPGLVWGGRELRDGMRLALERLEGEAEGRQPPFELAFADSGGTPQAGVAALEDLLRQGAVALVGEYHSVVAEAVARRAGAIQVPFLCASATLDVITARRSPWVFRLAPPQSYGWSAYADFLRSRGFLQVAALVSSDLYWSSGAAVLHRRLSGLGVDFRQVGFTGSIPQAVQELESIAGQATRLMALLLVGYPEPT